MALNLKGYLAYRCFQMLKMAHDLRYLYELLSKEVENFELKELFRQEREGIEQQVHNLEETLSRLGAGLALPTRAAHTGVLEASPETLALMAERGGHPLTQGIMQEHQMFMRMDPSPRAVELHDLLEADQVEQIELAMYDGLIALAEELHATDAVELLRKSRQEESESRERLQDRMHSLLGEYGGPQQGEEQAREAA